REFLPASHRHWWLLAYLIDENNIDRHAGTIRLIGPSDATSRLCCPVSVLLMIPLRGITQEPLPRYYASLGIRRRCSQHRPVQLRGQGCLSPAERWIDSAPQD